MGKMTSRASLWFLLAFATLTRAAPAWYDTERKQILSVEAMKRTGGALHLSSKEQALSDLMTSEKARVIKSARLNDTIFPPAVNFFQSKEYMDQSPIFKIIQEMPKGGALHLHDSSTVSLDWVIKDLTYRPHLYRCFDNYGELVMNFFDVPPKNDSCKWELVSSARATAGNTAFDQALLRNISIVADHPETAYPTLNAVWRRFRRYFKAMSFRSYQPALRDYVYRMVEEFLADNVNYLEIRVGSSGHLLNGTYLSLDWLIQLHQQVFNEFKTRSPAFIGGKLIYSRSRSINPSAIQYGVNDSIRYRQKYPDVFLGFDLVGQEDLGHTQYDFLNQLLYPNQHHEQLPYYFHAGETNWQGDTDLNMVDAVLLNTSRIGHGFALIKHPEVLRLSQERSIAVEVNPISNQVLKLVSDLRNHPAAILLANNNPVVISSDDPAAWNAKPLSHDFYVTFMALTSENDDLRVLKQLAINSFLYSGMTKVEKDAALKKWENLWNAFIDKAYDQYVIKGVPFG